VYVGFPPTSPILLAGQLNGYAVTAGRGVVAFRQKPAFFLAYRLYANRKYKMKTYLMRMVVTNYIQFRCDFEIPFICSSLNVSSGRPHIYTFFFEFRFPICTTTKMQRDQHWQLAPQTEHARNYFLYKAGYRLYLPVTYETDELIMPAQRPQVFSSLTRMQWRDYYNELSKESEKREALYQRLIHLPIKQYQAACRLLDDDDVEECEVKDYVFEAFQTYIVNPVNQDADFLSKIWSWRSKLTVVATLVTTLVIYLRYTKAR
jgi:hypothetical protein